MNDDTDSEEVMSDGDSVESKKTAKSVSRSKHKHCLTVNCGGKLIKGCNWVKHTDRKHSKGIVAYESCTGRICTYCKASKFCTHCAYFLYPLNFLTFIYV